MKKKGYAKWGFWVTVTGVIIAIASANPARTKRILCRIAVGLEIFKTIDECQDGCHDANKKPDPKKTPASIPSSARPEPRSKTRGLTMRQIEPGCPRLANVTSMPFDRRAV